jgi:hypothetical protein
MSDTHDSLGDGFERNSTPAPPPSNVLPVQFSSRHDNADFGSGGAEAGRAARFGDPNIFRATEDDTPIDFLKRHLQLCRDSASSFSEAKLTSDLRARRHLIDVATTVLSPHFDLDQAATILGCKVSKAVRRNPYKFLIQGCSPDRDRKVVSNQSIALVYALQQCEMSAEKLISFFEKTSIKQCIRAYRDAKKGERKEKNPPVNDNHLVLEGAPAGQSGEIVVRIEIHGNKARFVALVRN